MFFLPVAILGKVYRGALITRRRMLNPDSFMTFSRTEQASVFAMSPSTAPGKETFLAQRDGKEADVVGNPATGGDTVDSSSSEHEDIDGDYGSYSNHAFSDPKIAAYWRGIYETAQYEGRHRFDPSLTWSATEEKRLKRKVSHATALTKTLTDCKDRLENHDMGLVDVCCSRAQPP